MQKELIHWLHHILFDPLTTWEQIKVTLMLGPLAGAMFVAIAWLIERAGRTGD